MIEDNASIHCLASKSSENISRLLKEGYILVSGVDCWIWVEKKLRADMKKKAVCTIKCKGCKKELVLRKSWEHISRSPQEAYRHPGRSINTLCTLQCYRCYNVTMLQALRCYNVTVLRCYRRLVALLTLCARYNAGFESKATLGPIPFCLTSNMNSKLVNLIRALNFSLK